MQGQLRGVAGSPLLEMQGAASTRLYFNVSFFRQRNSKNWRTFHWNIFSWSSFLFYQKSLLYLLNNFYFQALQDKRNKKGDKRYKSLTVNFFNTLISSLIFFYSTKSVWLSLFSIYYNLSYLWLLEAIYKQNRSHMGFLASN